MTNQTLKVIFDFTESSIDSTDVENFATRCDCSGFTTTIGTYSYDNLTVTVPSSEWDRFNFLLDTDVAVTEDDIDLILDAKTGLLVDRQ